MQSDEKTENSEFKDVSEDLEGAEKTDGSVSDLDEARAKAEKANQDVLYLRAEFENTRRRLLREQEQAIRFANEKLIGEIFRVVDLFDRAIASSAGIKTGATPEVNSFVTGVEMTQKELVSVLEKFGVEFLGQVGEKFDPQRHEAVSQVPGPSEKTDTVIQVFQRGCAVHGRTLVPAKVVVGIS